MQVAEFISEKQRLILETCERLHTTPAELWRRAEQLNGELRDMSKKVDRLNAKVANYEIINLFNFTKAVGDVNVLAVKLDDIDMDTLRGMGDMIRDRAPKLVAVLSIVADGKINFLCVCGKEAVAKGAHAGNIIREVAKLCGGGGGGKPGELRKIKNGSIKEGAAAAMLPRQRSCRSPYKIDMNAPV